MILYLAADLIWASKIKGCADALGLACRPVRTIQMLDARLADSNPVAVLLDLTATEMALEMLDHLRGPENSHRHRSVRIVAFGPHVEKSLFQQAREAGADEVLTRGALDHDMDEVLLRLSARSSRGTPEMEH